jgi:hypothetical protein
VPSRGATCAASVVMPYLRWLYLCVPLTACAVDANDVTIELAPDLISSIDGTLAVHATVFRDRDPSRDEGLQLVIAYTDRNGAPHSIAPIDGKTDATGAFDATISGLLWDGTGTVKATVMNGTAPAMVGGHPLETSATFAVLDRTPPKATIVPPASNRVSAGNGTTVQVHVTDEIGISEVYFEWGGFQGRERTLVTSGAADLTVDFDVQPQDIQVGTSIMLYALAQDLSGNQGAATPISVTVVQ